MLGLSANLNYYLFNGNVDLRKGIFRLCESIREEMSLDPSDASNVYMFMSRNRKVVKILHYERGFYVLYEKRTDNGAVCHLFQAQQANGCLEKPMVKGTLFRCGVWHMEEIKGNPKSQEAYETSKQV